MQIKRLKQHANTYRFIQNRTIANYKILSGEEDFAYKTQESQIWYRRSLENPEDCKKCKKSKCCCKWSKYIQATYSSDRDYRDMVCTEVNNSGLEWVLETPSYIRRHASNTVMENIQTSRTLLKNGTIKRFNVRFKKRKEQTRWSLGGIDYTKVIHKRCIEIPGLNAGRFKTCEDLPDEKRLQHECMLHYDGVNYYVIIPEEVKSKSIIGRNPLVSLDPGVRSFQCCYDPSNKQVIDVGKEASTKMHQKLILLDKMISRKANKKLKLNYQTRRLLTLKIEKLRLKIQNYQKELHGKVALWLCKNYDEIVMPHFGSKQMSEKVSRKIATKTVRNMMVLGHCKFLEKLKTKAQEYNVLVTIVDECHTTMTCGKCKHRQKDIKSKKEWRCSRCDTVHLRDCNAARNILMKKFKAF